MVTFDSLVTKSIPTGFSRHFRGWQPGLLLLLIAGGAILLVTPRAVEPVDYPEPHIDMAALERGMAEDDALAREASRVELDVDVRALGRELRDYNLAAVKAEEDEALARDEFARARARVSAAALKVGLFGEQLRELRAYQLARFLEELRAWQATGDASDELRAMSGDFIDTLNRNRWCWPGSRELVPGERELRVLFKKRWNSLVGAQGDVLALTLDEERVRLGFLLLHPFIHNEPAARGITERSALERLTAASRMQMIEKLAVLDPAYPAELARSVVFYRTGQFQPATQALRKHLEAHPNGPYALRARNYLKAALDQTVTPLL